MKQWVVALAVATVYILHQDYWNWGKASPVVCGVLPVGLAYHAGFSICASLLMYFLVKTVWPKHLDSGEDTDTPNEAHS